MEKEVVMVVITAGLTLFCKWLWDRYFSQSNRVTAKEFKEKMKEIESQLAEGRETFKKIGSCIQASCLIMLQLCEKAQIDCAEIKKKMIESGLNL